MKFLIVPSCLTFSVLAICFTSPPKPSASLSGKNPASRPYNTPVDTTTPAFRLCTEMIPKPKDTDQKGKTGGVYTPSCWKWQPGQRREITVCFKDGLPAIQNRIKTIAAQWESITNAKFVYIPYSPFANIKISFAKKGVSWSYIGTDSHNQNPSMNFGWLEEEKVDTLFEAVVLHEFGHAIGLVHEHQLPNGNPIEWNVNAVYSYYMGYPNYWKKADIDKNILNRYAKDRLMGGQYDPASIMIYHIPADLTKNKYSTPLNVRISAGDKKAVAAAYHN